MATTRMLRHGWISSDRINKLDWRAEVFYLRLCLDADDYGLFDARPIILRATLYPLAYDHISEDDVTTMLKQVEAVGLVETYTVDNKPYGVILNYGQRKQSRPRCPFPPKKQEAPTEDAPGESPTTQRPRDTQAVKAYMGALSSCQLETQELSRCAEAFWQECEGGGWITRAGHPIANWKPLASRWLAKWQINNARPNQQRYRTNQESYDV